MITRLDISTDSRYPMNAEGSGLRGAFFVAPDVWPRTTATFSKSAARGSGPHSLEGAMQRKGVPWGTRFSGAYVNCATCGKHFWAQQSYLDRGGGRYCSKTCHSAALTTCRGKPCIECGRPSAHAKGLCPACYQRQRTRTSLEARAKANRQAAKYAREHPVQVSIYHKARHSRIAFSGRDILALERDGYRCIDCGTNQNANGDRLDVHHLDGNGLSVPCARRNNELSNLITLCRGCHRKREAARKREDRNAAA